MMYKYIISLSFILSLIVWQNIILYANEQVSKRRRAYEIYITKPITNMKLLPKSFTIPGIRGRVLNVSACRGEYEPASFVIHALNEIKNLVIIPTDLIGEKSSIPARAVDIRIVKCWFQAGVAISETNKCILTPELLLKDDKLIYVDFLEKKNYLRIIDSQGKTNYILISGRDSENLKDIQPRDAETLQPIDIDGANVKQFWVTVQVPEEALPGDYHGKIILAADKAPATEISMRLKVLPFALEKPALRYSIYYIGRLNKNKKGSIGQSWKSPQQYLAEMQDLKAHGVEYPTFAQEQFDQDLFRQELAIRSKAGLPGGPLYHLGFKTGNPNTAEELNKLKSQVRKILKAANQYGYEEVYFYGIDEAKGDQLKSQRPAWGAVHEAGGKIFVASHTGAFEVMGDLLDLSVHGGWVWQEAPKYQSTIKKWGRLIPEEARKYHHIGHQIFSYGNPQAGQEEPETYRRNYGLLLWKAGYDGAMNCAYQLQYNNIWNDFDSKEYRDHVFAYPTVNGVIDTIQWEGFREGVDDVRYLTTMLKAINNVKATKPQLATEAEIWVDRLDPQADLNTLREKIIDWIIKLQ